MVIRANFNARSQGVPIDEENEAVITTPYSWNGSSWVPVTSPGVVNTAKATYTNAGTYTLHAPSAGKAIQTVWLYVQAKASLGTGVVLITLTLDSDSYDLELTGSQPFAHGAKWQGAINSPFTVTIATPADVIVNLDYTEA